MQMKNTLHCYNANFMVHYNQIHAINKSLGNLSM